jgi:hypothetical protein
MTNSEANEILARHGRDDILRFLRDQTGDPHYMTADGRIRRVGGAKVVPVSRHAVALMLLGNESELGGDNDEALLGARPSK